MDLLVPARGEPYRTVELPDLGAHATAIPHLKYLLEAPTHSILLGRDRIVPVAIPDAGRYCVHKLAVYSLRGGNNPKRAKDLQQAALLAVAMTHERDFKLRDAIDALSPSLRRLAKAGARDASAMITGDHVEAADALRAIG